MYHTHIEHVIKKRNKEGKENETKNRVYFRREFCLLRL